uniref:Uncharacterized protein n=1 Tax=Tetranychus urticae TaxID=32264 RepID=T1KPY8_TETUR
MFVFDQRHFLLLIKATINTLIWISVAIVLISHICLVNGSKVYQWNEKKTVEPYLDSNREMVDIHYLYNISFNKLKVKKCMNSHGRQTADCVYNSEKKWGPISDEDIKSACCSFWEADECLTQLVVHSCTKNESLLYTEDAELTVNRKLLQNGYCSSYQQMSDCDFPFWLVVAIIVSLVILFFICGFAVLNNFMRRESVNSKLIIYNQKSTVNRHQQQRSQHY